MKKVIALAVLLFASASIQAQKKENFEFIGGGPGLEFYVNYKEAKGTFENIVFYGALVTDEGAFISTFRGDCKARTVAFLEEREAGAKTGTKVDKPKAEKVPEGSAIAVALDLTCKKRFGEAI